MRRAPPRTSEPRATPVEAQFDPPLVTLERRNFHTTPARRANRTTKFAVLEMALLAVFTSTLASAQGWVSTATKAYPVQNVSNVTLIGALAPSTSVHIVVGLQEQNANQVQPTLKRMLTPGDSLYGTSLSVQQFVQQFGPTAAQVQAVESYLTSNGFTNVTVADNQLLVEADGIAANAEAAFNTSLSQYSLNGATVFANSSDAQVPASLSGTVLAVLGLNNIVSLHSDLVHLNTGPQTVPCSPPQCPTPDTSNETFTPQQYQISYDAACPADNPNCPAKNFPTGKSTAVGIIAEGDLTQVVKDLRTYETTYKLPQVPVTIVNAGIPSPDTSGADEWDLDSQTSTGIAQQVSHLYFYVATSLTDSDLGLAINKAVSGNLVKAFNMSLGECEFYAFADGSMLLDDEIFGEAALQGITPFASSDDNGSACPVNGNANGVPLSGPPDTSYFASSPYVVAVGGTYLFTTPITLTISRRPPISAAVASATSKFLHSGRPTREPALCRLFPALRPANGACPMSRCAPSGPSWPSARPTSSPTARPRSSAEPVCLRR
jgi:pseudomonalisin